MISADYLLNHDYPLALDPSFEGCCPCALIEGDKFVVSVHCWRTDHDGCKCKYSGIHVSGNISNDLKRRIAKHIRDNNGWSEHTDWTLVIDGCSDKTREGGGKGPNGEYHCGQFVDKDAPDD